METSVELVWVRGIVVLLVLVAFVFGVVTVDLLDDRVETVFVVSSVLDHPGGTVRLHQAVRALDVAVPVAHLVLALNVVRVQVLDAVLEVVRCGRVVVVQVRGVPVSLVTGGRVSRDGDQQGGEHDHLKRKWFVQCRKIPFGRPLL